MSMYAANKQMGHASFIEVDTVLCTFQSTLLL